MLDGRWPAPSGGGPGLGTGGPGFAAPPVGCFLLAAATLAWYASYAFSLAAQACCVVYAARQASTAVRMFATVWLTWDWLPVLPALATVCW
ncbi:MAG: hypothetical protein JO244_12750 [Solirubrobacterales bacterium]|nr:hypothetical protein [Solirubrobacterales bacterium]